MATAKRVPAAKKAGASSLPLDYGAAFAALRSVFAEVAPKLHLAVDNEKEYTLHTQVASPFKQHKGAAMFFGSVRNGKAYASFHLFPLYMNAELTGALSPELKKRMQGKTCFNFKSEPEPALAAELKTLTKAGFRDFQKRGWA